MSTNGALNEDVMSKTKYGAWGKLLCVDLTQGKLWDEEIDELTFRQYIGGTGLGMKYLFEKVSPKLDWSDAKNILFVAPGPFGGTKVAGGSSISFVTKGAMTNGATSSQANGFFGAYLKFCGYDAILVQGASSDWKYLYIHDGGAELKDASHLLGKDTWQTEETIKEELSYKERTMSVFSIGPAGENLVRFACIVGDRGHTAGHNGIGAVMGSKKLKAFAVARGTKKVGIFDQPRFSEIRSQIVQTAKEWAGGNLYYWGTSRMISSFEREGLLPVKNYLTDIFPEHELFVGDRIRPLFESTNYPCYACAAHHYELMRVTEGPYTGYFGKEPEYEQWASWGPQIYQKDPGAALMLANEVDRLGMDTNESSWIVGWVMECYEKGVLTKDTLDGLEMTWGNAEATLALLKNIAYRRGYGKTLAEGVKHAAEQIGGEAANWAIFTGKRNTPRDHDHRARWVEMIDSCVSDGSTLETVLVIKDMKLWNVPQPPRPFDPDWVATAEANSKGSLQVSDCLVHCWFQGLSDTETQTKALNAITGWNMSVEEVKKVGRRIVNIMRIYNIKAGLTPDMEKPSSRYCSQPVDGPNKDKYIAPHLEYILDKYYELMGWDRKTGMPLLKTIKELGLEDFVRPK